MDAATRRRRLYLVGAAALGLFVVLRLLNGYGEPVPRVDGATPLVTLITFLNLTKYPPSLDFLLLTLGAGALLLTTFGTAPLFFYLVHLYLLHALNRLALLALGPNEGSFFSVPNIASLWGLAVAVSVPLGFACRGFAALKARSNRAWMSYL